MAEMKSTTAEGLRREHSSFQADPTVTTPPTPTMQFPVTSASDPLINLASLPTEQEAFAALLLAPVAASLPAPVVASLPAPAAASLLAPVAARASQLQMISSHATLPALSNSSILPVLPFNDRLQEGLTAASLLSTLTNRLDLAHHLSHHPTFRFLPNNALAAAAVLPRQPNTVPNMTQVDQLLSSYLGQPPMLPPVQPNNNNNARDQILASIILRLGNLPPTFFESLRNDTTSSQRDGFRDGSYNREG